MLLMTVSLLNDDCYDYPGGKPVCSVEDQLGQTRQQDEPHHRHLDDNGETYDRDEETYDYMMTMVKLMMTKIFGEKLSHLIFHLCPSPTDQAEKWGVLVLTVSDMMDGVGDWALGEMPKNICFPGFTCYS